MAAKTLEERERRLQWMSTNQHERLAVKEPTSTKGWQLKPPRGKITANVPSTAQRLTEQETIPQSINDNLISNNHSLLCKFLYNMHVNYSATT